MKQKKPRFKAANPRNTETDAYEFIRATLHSLGWNTKNPSRHPDGQVYIQNECHSHAELKKCLGGGKPEAVVKIAENIFWIIESKKEHGELSKALKEAKVDYATLVNKSKTIKAVIISGVAGNRTDSYLITSEYFDGTKWQPITINGQKASGLLKPDEVKILLAQNSAIIEDIVIDEKLFLEKAENINEILHRGAINKNQRAKVMAALLLSLIDETPPNIQAQPRALIRDINTRVENVLEKHQKSEFTSLIQINLPPSKDNHFKYRAALVDTIQELNILNIRSAMNSGKDVLGKFYEVFLKYGNGAKEIGIVLTPRHITRFTVEVLNLGINDLVYDPTCGTAGFLVAAFDYVKKNASRNQIEQFRKHNLFGIEQEPEVVALAIVNMIFRGDGKTNIEEGVCFQKNIERAVKRGIPTATYETANQPNTNPAITKVLMNPPFALESSVEKEYHFVQYALDQMVDGGILFSVLPISVLCESGEEKEWRLNRLLAQNTLLSVISFPPELFYPIGVYTIGMFVKKGVPHPINQNVFWARIQHDGLLKIKGKRLPTINEPNEFDKIMSPLRAFINDHEYRIENEPEFCKLSPINFDDSILELIPEAYIDSKSISSEEIHKEAEKLVRENTALIIRYGREINAD